MTFWAQLKTAERERLDQWQDVEPALCLECNTVRRGVLLGCCADCFALWKDEHDRTPL